MRDLVQKLPAGNQQDVGTSDDTIAAVLATLNEVIKKHPEFSRYLRKYYYFLNMSVIFQTCSIVITLSKHVFLFCFPGRY